MIDYKKLLAGMTCGDHGQAVFENIDYVLMREALEQAWTAQENIYGESIPAEEIPVPSSAPTRLTTDPTDTRLTHGVDSTPVDQADVYLVLGEDERAEGFVRPVRQEYRHTICGNTTRMGLVLSETYARDPTFYGSTYCVHCRMHRPVSEFTWTDGGEVVGS